MSERRSDCPDCQSTLQPINLIDATAGPGWDQEGIQHIELAYAAPDATRSFFRGKIQRQGVVKGLICPACGRILYGDRTS